MNSIILSRRKFLQAAGVVGGGLIIGFSLTSCSSDEPPVQALQGGFVPNAFLQITPDSKVRFYCPRAEMGQGVTTGLGTVIAEQLDFDPTHLDVMLVGANKAYDNPDLGIQGTGGSTSMHAHFDPLSEAGAITRSLLLDAAAKDLGVPRDSLRTEDGHVIAGGVRHPYGKFVATAATLKPPRDVKLKSKAEYRYIGKEFPRLDALAKATGTAVYAVDVDLPGMHYAVVRRSPVAGAKLASCDTSKVRKMPGVTDVVNISSGVAVVAQKFWQAKTAAEALQPEWEKVALEKYDTAMIRNDYQHGMEHGKSITKTERGDLGTGFKGAASVLDNEYWAPFLAHAPMEPMSAVIRLGKGEADLWAGTQGPMAARGLVARFSGIKPEKVRVHSTYMGGAFGRRATLTHIIEITQIAVATGKPIHLLWSREADLRNGVYRPASLMRIKAGLTADGTVSTWQAKRVGGNITPETLKNMMPGLFPGVPEGAIHFMVGLADDYYKGWAVDGSSVEGLGADYDFPNLRVDHSTVEHGVPLTFWRSVGHSYTAFAKESMIDELAEKAGKDPVGFRLENTKNNPVLANVIKVAGEQMDKMQVPAGHRLGFAAHTSFRTHVAEIAEVSVDNNQIRVHKVICVVDCGLAVNPRVIRAQMEGAIMYGLTAALYGKLNLVNGAFTESNFNNYPILRMDAAPSVEVIIIDSDKHPTGVGEPGLPPIAPAVANAVYRITGKRLRSLPLELGA